MASLSKSKLAQSCLTLCDPVDCSLPDSPVHGIFQTRVLEWVAIAFSNGVSWAYPNFQYYHSCVLGPLLSKISVIRMQEL